MKRKKLLRQLYPLQLFITITALLAVTWYVSQSNREFHLQQTAKDLEARAQLIYNQVSENFLINDIDKLHSLCDEAAEKSATRITVINATGEVLIDTEENPARMDNHADRPEVIAALAGKPAPSTRFSNTLHENMMYVAIPITKNSEISGVLRTSIPVTAIDKALSSMYFKIIFFVVAVSLLAAFGAWISSRHIIRPLEIMKKGAERFAKGDFSRKLIVLGSEELSGLATSLNMMAEQLDGRIKAVVRQRNELEAIFTSMIEGVFVFDKDERFISMNIAGAHLINANHEKIQGKAILEVVRNSDLLRFVKKTLAGKTPVEGEIILNDVHGERFFQAHGVPLTDSRGDTVGGLIVANDVTRLRRLERVRRDFVANVSHEIRTPITSIKGFIETLQEGAMEDPDHAGKFLAIIAGQTNRLNAIIDDLLTLSRIEQQAEKAEITLRKQPVIGPIKAAIQACSAKAEEKNIHITCTGTEGLSALINAPLLEQALVNIIDNALKYSPDTSAVEITADMLENSVCIAVKDTGKGISPEHQQRLFERFYRVDNARSNKIEGTGLGLAIVKYIVQAHNGEVTVHSSPGKGSKFSINLPA